MNGSTTRRVAPARSQVLAIVHDARDSWIAGRVGEHLSASLAIVLSVVVSKRNTQRIVMIARLLAVRTPRFGIDNNRQLTYLRMSLV